MNVWRHSGDLGDVVAALPVIRQLGGGQLILGNVNGVGAREPMTEERYRAIAPLLECQPYIHGVSHEHDAKGVTHDFHNFRNTPIRTGEEHSLIRWQADYFGLSDVDISPWLSNIEPHPDSKGRVVFARTTRYHNPLWNWRAVSEKYPNSMFIGFQDEWEELCRVCGKQLEWRRTANLLEVAQLIKGSDLFISNQSAGFWIAAGMGHPLIQESDRANLNSVIRNSFDARYEMDTFP